MLFGLVAPCVAFGFVTNDELKAQLLSESRLLTTHPAAAAAQLGLDENGQQTVGSRLGLNRTDSIARAPPRSRGGLGGSGAYYQWIKIRLSLPQPRHRY